MSVSHPPRGLPPTLADLAADMSSKKGQRATSPVGCRVFIEPAAGEERGGSASGCGYGVEAAHTVIAADSAKCSDQRRPDIPAAAVVPDIDV